MELSDFVFLKSVNPITIIEKPSKKTNGTLLKIIRDPEFKEWLDTTRKQLLLSGNPVDIRPLEGQNLLDPNGTASTFGLFLNIFAKQVINKYGFADDFMLNMALCIFFNAFIDLEYYKGLIERDIEFVPTKALTAYKLHSYKHEVGAILIPYQCSKQKLKKWIDKNWENMDKDMEEHLFEGTGILEVHKNTELGNEIDELHKKGKSYMEISTTLIDKYPDDKRLADPDQVRMIHNRHLEDLAFFASINKSEQ